MNTQRFLCRLSFREISTLIGLIAVVMPLTRLKADEATKQRFLREYPAASKALREKFENVRCRIRLREDADPESHFTEVRFWRSQGYDKAEITRFSDGSDTSIRPFEAIIRQGKPIYFLQKNKENEPYEHWRYHSNPYELDNLWTKIRHPLGFRTGMSSLSSEIYASSVDFNAGMRFSADCGTWVYGPFGGEIGLINDWTSNPRIVLVDAEPLAGSPEIIEVHLEYLDLKRPRHDFLQLDTTNLWAMKHHRIEIRGSSFPPRTREVRYGPKQDGIAWPVSSVIRKSPTGVTHSEFSDWSFEPTPVAEFRLSHYGLSDPLYDWRNPRTQAIAGIVAISLLLALTRIFWRKRRKRAATMPPAAESTSR